MSFFRSPTNIAIDRSTTSQLIGTARELACVGDYRKAVLFLNRASTRRDLTGRQRSQVNRLKSQYKKRM